MPATVSQELAAGGPPEDRFSRDALESGRLAGQNADSRPSRWVGGAMEAQKPAEGQCFRPLAGMSLVYEPGCGGQKDGKKHPCPDCSFCQFCAETRCAACRSEKNRKGGKTCRKLSLQEQVLLYEKLNAESAATG